MTTMTMHINEANALANRLAKLKPSAILTSAAPEEVESQDGVRISAEAKKRLALAQARTEVLDHIRRAK